ncbi:MAG: hypothetical protein GX179_04150 [Candidatus Cloacimonetes bacterium]|nr:hypothetical protein [Candidatus Cloacimonadota bacterium]HNZ88418.1 hypothetical protein [Candidatus Cloacimonas acidaminovorans]
MKKVFILLAVLLFFTGIIYAQAATTTTQQQPVKGFEGARRYVEEKELVIEIKALIPSTDIFQDKSDTYRKAGEYKFSFTIEDIHKQSDTLLNKWLKESK